jgi:hypothetical protein
MSEVGAWYVRENVSGLKLCLDLHNQIFGRNILPPFWGLSFGCVYNYCSVWVRVDFVVEGEGEGEGEDSSATSSSCCAA